MIELIKNHFRNYMLRLKNPLISTFLISFISFNWRPISIFILSNNEIEDVVKQIEGKYMTICGILVPVLLSIVYCISIPYLNALLSVIIEKPNKSQTKRENEQKLVVLNHKVEESILERKIAENIAGTQEIEDLTNSINNLSMDLEKSKNENEILKKEKTILLQESDKLKSDIEKSNNQNKTVRDFYNLLTDFSEFSDRNIKQYLKNNLKNNEVEKLKLNLITKQIDISEIDKHNIFLFERINFLIKTDLARKYYITDVGCDFINEL